MGMKWLCYNYKCLTANEEGSTACSKCGAARPIGAESLAPMTAANQESYPVKSSTAFWFGGCTFLLFGLVSLWDGLRGVPVYMYKHYGGGCLIEPWQSICIGNVALFMAIWDFTIAIQRTRLKKKLLNQSSPRP